MADLLDIVWTKRTVIVTVGTTSFDALVEAVDTPEVKQELRRRGYTDLIIQIGDGTYIPTKSSGERNTVSVDYFTFSSSLAEYLESASLVISHAGSRTIFETLNIYIPLIVVVNEDSIDNHQRELVEELAEKKHLLCCRPDQLYQTIRNLDLDSLRLYQKA